jgi:hypothetical protein
MKGMQKISRGLGFRGCLDYCNKGGEKIGGNMTGSTPRELATEFKLSRDQKDCKKPVWHSSLRLPAGDTLSKELWNEVAALYISRMGFNPDHQYCVFLHDDKKGQHIHIVASRVSLSGKLFYGQNENLQSTKVIHELEKRFSLTPTVSDAPPKKRRTPTKSEIEKSLRTLVKPDRVVLAEIIDRVLQTEHPKNPGDLKNALTAHGVETIFFEEDEKIQGITFSTGGLKFSGSALGPAYKFPALVQRMKYDTDDKTRFDQKPSNRAGNVPGHSVAENAQSKNQRTGKKGLVARVGKKATLTENQAFQLLQKGKNMNETQEMIGALSHARAEQAQDAMNIEHGWNEFTDRNGRVWFYDVGQPPAVGNRAGYSWDPAGNKDGPPAIRVWDCAVERHGIEQAAIDAVRICVFKSLPEPLRLHGSPEFQRYAAREMHRLGIGLQNTDGPGWEEYDRLEREKEKGTQDLVNSISATFQGIDDQAKATHRAALQRAADQEDTPSKKDDDRDRMRMRGPR